ncbi:unnamed protein product, partial [Prorocentrum cordatum]
ACADWGPSWRCAAKSRWPSSATGASSTRCAESVPETPRRWCARGSRGAATWQPPEVSSRQGAQGPLDVGGGPVLRSV